MRGVAVLVPWRPGDPDRERAWSFLRPRWEQVGEVIEGAAPGGPWCKAAAVADALTRTDADRLVIADADVWTSGIGSALHALDGRAWAVPHGKVARLTAEATDAAIGAGKLPTRPPRSMLAQQLYQGHPGGGITVIRRAVYEDCPLDRRFTGWGQEDDSWAFALRVLHGTPWRGDADLVHLWHEPQPRRDRLRGSVENVQLFERYRRARHSRRAMRALIEEAA